MRYMNGDDGIFVGRNGGPSIGWLQQVRPSSPFLLTTDRATSKGSGETLEKEALEQFCSEKLKTL
jgi:hypothetical protein